MDDRLKKPSRGPTIAPSSAIVGYRGARDSRCKPILETDIPSTSGYAILA
jgi:hypothetical protein